MPLPPWEKNWGQSSVADTMRAVKRAPFSLLLVSWVAYSSSSQAADDAYDDDAREDDAYDDDAYDDDTEVRHPRDHDKDDDEADEIEDGGLSAGGMNAPKALGETGDTRSKIERELEESDERDSGRGLQYFWLSADVGFQAMSLNALRDGGLIASGEPSGASGLAFGAGAGARLLYFSLGARFQYGNFSEFTPWSVLGEGALRVPLGKFEPFGLIGVGYTKVSGLSGSVGGADVRLGGGLDYYLSDSFSVGAQASGDLFFLSGPAGTAMGGGATGMVQLGLHF